jgi:hypothetical protein
VQLFTSTSERKFELFVHKYASAKQKTSKVRKYLTKPSLMKKNRERKRE